MTYTDPDILSEAKALVAEGLALLVRERGAITRLDGPTFTQLATDKSHLVARLAALVRQLPHPDPELKKATQELQAHACANAALLSDASQAMSAALGIRSTGTYDRYARPGQRRVAAFARRDI